jgi:hypothetical protein
MKKTFLIIWATLMILGLIACGETAPEQTQPESSETTSPAPDVPDGNQSQQMPDGIPNYFQISIADENGGYKALTAYEDGTGKVTVDYQSDIRKVTTMDISVMDQIAAELAKSGLMALNGENIYEENGLASASMYVAYADGDFLGAGYSGTIPQAFVDGYDAMDAWFRILLTDVPEYVPRPAVIGDVDSEVLAELEAILNASGMEPLDMFAISDVPKDEYFAMTLGLSGGDGIINGTSCGPVMSATAFSCVIVTLEDEGKISDVQKDFAANVDWNKWVCVSADAAMIARKGNMVLCLVGSAELYQKTANAIMASGWTTMETLER